MSQNFENLDMFKNARELTTEIYKLTNTQEFAKDYGLKDQIRRASVSILSNIAEGYERNSDREFIKFLNYSKGSCGEVRAQLMVARDLEYLNQENYEVLSDDAKHISSMISNYIKYLKSRDE